MTKACVVVSYSYNMITLTPRNNNSVKKYLSVNKQKIAATRATKTLQQ